MDDLDHPQPRQERDHRTPSFADLPVFLQRLDVQVDAAIATVLTDAAQNAPPVQHDVLAAAPREQLERFAALAQDAASANISLYLDERDKSAALWNALEEERRRVEFFKGLFDRAMSALEGLGGHELPELVQLRRDAAHAAPFTSQPSRLAQQARAGDEELLPRFVDLICEGEVTKSAAVKLEIGEVRAKRLRKLAVERGLLPPRRRR